MSRGEFSREIAKADLEISPAAREALARILAGCDDPSVCGIRLLVVGRGCSGMTYALTFTDQCREHDHVLDTGDFHLFVDVIAFSYLQGAEIDFQQRRGGDSFVFHNVFQATGGSGLCGGCAAV